MNDGKIIIDKIIADAEETAKKIIADANVEADRTIAAAEERAAKEKARYDKLIADEKKKVIAKQISAAHMQTRKSVLAAKQEILAEIIDEAENTLIGLPDDEYARVIGGMLDKIDKSLGTDVVVSEKDKARLAGVISEKGFTLSDKIADINGGFVIINGDIEYNYSFGAIISIEKEEIQQLAAKILFE